MLSNIHTKIIRSFIINNIKLRNLLILLRVGIYVTLSFGTHSSLKAAGYLCYLQAIHRLIDESHRLPWREKLLELSPDELVIVMLVVYLCIVCLKAYAIGIVWRCYKYLTLRQQTTATITYNNNNMNSLSVTLEEDNNNDTSNNNNTVHFNANTPPMRRNESIGDDTDIGAVGGEEIVPPPAYNEVVIVQAATPNPPNSEVAGMSGQTLTKATNVQISSGKNTDESQA
uniref:Uncharacterized protein n=1 Tax=Glossina austeni TaxID=7395 RepID=A0A1A9URT7_GLOAU